MCRTNSFKGAEGDKVNKMEHLWKALKLNVLSYISKAVDLLILVYNKQNQHTPVPNPHRKQIQ